MPTNGTDRSSLDAEAFPRDTPDTLVLRSLKALEILEPDAGSEPAGPEALSIGALHQATFVQLPLGIGYASRDGRFIWCNTAFDQMLGLERGEHRNKTIKDLTHSADFQSNDQLLQELWDGQRDAYSLEKRYVRRDGQSLWVRVTAALVRDPAGRAVCTVGFLEDISARRAAEQALQASQQLIEAVANSVPVALIASDPAGAITFSNRAAAELDALNPDADLRCPDGVTALPRSEHPLSRALQGESLANVEFVIAQPGGQCRTFQANACPLKSPEGKALGAVAAYQDITHLRETEAEVERIHKDLMDASRNAGMAEVATNVLHNVGNVLNSVNVSATLAIDGLKRGKGARLTDVARLLADHRDDLAGFLTRDPRGRQLPEFLTQLASHTQSEREAVLQELEALRANLDHIKDAVSMQQDYARRCGVIEQVEVRDLVEDSLRMNAGALMRHHVQLNRKFHAVPPITTDKHKVLQILVNLIRNAKYACDESGQPDKCVTVGINPAGDGRGVRIVVSDNGIGIAPETMARLFTHGFTTRRSGHGFGLHSAALAATELGGRLSAHSDGLGRGAAFTLELPVVLAEKRA